MTTTLSQTGSQIQVDLNAVEAGNIGKTSITDLTDTTVAAAKKSGYHSLQASSSNAPSADRSVIVSAVRNTSASGELRYGQVLLSESNKLYWNTDDGGVLGTWREAVSTAGGQTLTNKTITGGSLAINTISEESSGAGVTIDSVLLKDNTVLAGTLTAGAGSITDSSGAISFGNENLSTTGTLSVGGTLGVTGVLTGTSLDISGDIDVDGTTNLDIVDIDGAVDMASTLTVASNIVVGGTVDGRDVANDGTKLDGIEASADVTDAANVTAAGALMDSELTAIASVKALNQGVATGDSPQFVGITSTSNVIVGGNLTVNGTTTTLNTATLDVEDKNITVNYGAGDTTGSANGAGLTIQDAVDASTDATILWDTTNDEFDFSHPINVTGKVTGTGTSVFASLDISGDIDVDGTTNLDIVDIDGAVDMASTALVTGVLTTTATQVATGGITSGSDIISDTDSTDSLGSTTVRWLKGWFDTLTAGTLTAGSGSVTDSSGAISFGDENLTTTGTLASGALDVTGTTTGSGYLYLSSKTANQGLRLNNTTKIQSWNAAGTALRDLMELDASEDVRIGSSANDIYLDNDTTVTGALDVTGNIGIGVTAISTHSIYAGDDLARLKLEGLGTGGANQATVQFYNEGTFKGQIGYRESSDDFEIWSQNGSLPTMQMDVNNNVSIPNGVLTQGDFSSPATSNGLSFSAGQTATSRSITTNADHATFHNPNGKVGSIRTNGTTTAFVTSSDPRLKSEFTPITGASEMILEARDKGMVGEFHFLSDPTQTVWGYNAHKVADLQAGLGGSEGEGPRDAELGSVYEEAVMGERPIMVAELDDEGEPTGEMIESGEMEVYEVSPEKVVSPAGIDQSKRVPMLEAAIGELLDRIAVIEASNEALLDRITALENA